MAYETARQLEARGHKVALLALFDTFAWSFRRYLLRRYSARLRYRLKWGLTPWIWDYLRVRTPFHLREVSQLEGKRLRYLLDKTGKALSSIPRAFHHQRSAQPRNGNRNGNVNHKEKAYHMAVSRYRLRRYNGRIILLVNEEWHNSEPTLGWTNFAAGGLDIYKIPGNHDTCTPDNISLVANILKEHMHKAEQEV